MTYRKRYEDSYLDEDEEFDATDSANDGENLVALIQKQDRTEKENARIAKLVERLFKNVQMPEPLRSRAIEGLENAAFTYAAVGLADASVELWARLADAAQVIGNKELYYRATEQIAGDAPAVYDEYHPDLFG